MAVTTENHLLACKALDLLFWKSIRITTFDNERSEWHANLEIRLAMCIKKHEVTSKDEAVVRHYVLCLLLIHTSTLYPENIDHLKERHHSSEKPIELMRPIDLKNSWLLLYELIREIGVDPDLIQRLFKELFNDLSLNFRNLPSAYLVDFLTTSYLFEDNNSPIRLLSLFAKHGFLTPKTRPKSGASVTPLIRLALISQFTDLAVKKWHWVLSIRGCAEALHTSQPMGMRVNFDEFNTKLSCDILTDVILQRPPSIEKLHNLAHMRDGESIDTDILLAWMWHTVKYHDLQVFNEDSNGDVPFRIGKITSYILSHFITTLKNSDGEEFYSKTVYSSNYDKAPQNEESDVKPSITEFWSTYLWEEFTVSIAPKTLWATEAKLAAEPFHRIAAQWIKYEEISNELSFTWYQTQVQLSHLNPFFGCISGSDSDT